MIYVHLADPGTECPKTDNVDWNIVCQYSSSIEGNQIIAADMMELEIYLFRNGTTNKVMALSNHVCIQ